MEEEEAFDELVEKMVIAWLEFDLNWKHQIENHAL